jgi:hypothetical protein
MTQTKYFVLNENALCYRIEGTIFSGVLASSVIRGGPDPLCGMIYVGGGDTTRPATLEDFAAYRVSPKGHLEES